MPLSLAGNAIKAHCMFSLLVVLEELGPGTQRQEDGATLPTSLDQRDRLPSASALGTYLLHRVLWTLAFPPRSGEARVAAYLGMCMELTTLHSSMYTLPSQDDGVRM